MNPWMAGTTYTPESGLGSLFKRGLDGGVQGMSQKGFNVLGAGMQGAGQGMMRGGQQGGPMGAFASGLGNGMGAMRQQPGGGGQAPPMQGAFSGLRQMFKPQGQMGPMMSPQMIGHGNPQFGLMGAFSGGGG